jgi:tetratricopeptide (TPR) repeat protein
VVAVDPVIATLCDNGLLQFDDQRPDAPYSMLEPLRDVAARMLESSDRKQGVLDGLVDECVRRSHSYDRQMRTIEMHHPLRVRIERELPWHRQAIQYLSTVGDSARALQIAAGLEWPLYTLGWWRENTELQDAALAIPSEPTAMRARVHAARGRPGLLHEVDEEHTTTALEIAIVIGDRRIEAKALSQLGIKHWWDRRYDDALDALGRSVDTARRCGDTFLEQESERFAGITLVSAGRADEGFAMQLDVLDRAERSSNAAVMVPHIHMYLGHCRRHVGDDDAAFVDLEQARDAYERATNRATLVHVYAALVEMSIDRGDVPSALRYAGRGLELSAQGGVSAYDPWMLCTLARSHAASGQGEAARYASAAAVSSLATGWRGETHRVAVELASVALQLGDLRSAGRLIGLADVTDDRRDLPFVSPAERARAERVRAIVADGAGDDGEEAREGARLGAGSTLAEAASRLTSPVDAA